MEVTLPSNVPLDDNRIQGPVRQNKTLAKRAACLKVVRCLHMAGQLTDNLVPLKGNNDGALNGPQLQGDSLPVFLTKSFILQLDNLFMRFRIS